MDAALERALGQEIVTHRLGIIAHATLDSYYKYLTLDDLRFDLVIVYHGINELRANNVPEHLWRDDHAHYTWYDEVNFYFRHPILTQTVFLTPLFVKAVTVECQRTIWQRTVPPHCPKPGWVAYGAHVKTVQSFRQHLQQIAHRAAARNEPLLLMTFASYVPEDYSQRRFINGELAYQLQEGLSHPIELWGEPAHIITGLRMHNQAVRTTRFVAHITDVLQEQWVPARHYSDAGTGGGTAASD